MDELRDVIWQYLFRARAAKSIDEIATYAGQDASDVRMAVNHEWFSVSDDQVSIAFTAPVQRDH